MASTLENKARCRSPCYRCCDPWGELRTGACLCGRQRRLAPPLTRAAPGPSAQTPLPAASELSPDELATVQLFKENTPAVGQGSGFVWDTKGHIVTNAHVIRGAAEVQVALIDQQVFPAKIIGGDVSKDIAVLQLEAPKEVLAQLKPITLGASSNLAVGQRVYAIGNPFGLDHTLTSGIISGLNRELSSGGAGPSLRNVIQTDAAINPGNSGGVLLDSKGRLIGINTAIADPSGRGGFSGVGFAIPIDTVKGLVEQILTYGRVVRPVLGINLAPPQALRQLGLQGVLVLDVPPGTPATKAGIEGLRRDGYGRLTVGDVIIGMNGKQVRNEADLFNILDDCKVGDAVKLDLLRHGRERKTVSVVLAERQPEPTEPRVRATRRATPCTTRAGTIPHDRPEAPAELFSSALQGLAAAAGAGALQAGRASRAALEHAGAELKRLLEGGQGSASGRAEAQQSATHMNVPPSNGEVAYAQEAEPDTEERAATGAHKGDAAETQAALSRHAQASEDWAAAAEDWADAAQRWVASASRECQEARAFADLLVQQAAEAQAWARVAQDWVGIAREDAHHARVQAAELLRQAAALRAGIAACRAATLGASEDPPVAVASGAPGTAGQPGAGCARGEGAGTPAVPLAEHMAMLRSRVAALAALAGLAAVVAVAGLDLSVTLSCSMDSRSQGSSSMGSCSTYLDESM
eukprot:scaffold1.g5565.t1